MAGRIQLLTGTLEMVRAVRGILGGSAVAES
jgi:hypothetical protein